MPAEERAHVRCDVVAWDCCTGLLTATEVTMLYMPQVIQPGAVLQSKLVAPSSAAPVTGLASARHGRLRD